VFAGSGMLRQAAGLDRPRAPYRPHARSPGYLPARPVTAPPRRRRRTGRAAPGCAPTTRPASGPGHPERPSRSRSGPRGPAIDLDEAAGVLGGARRARLAHRHLRHPPALADRGLAVDAHGLRYVKAGEDNPGDGAGGDGSGPPTGRAARCRGQAARSAGGVGHRDPTTPASSATAARSSRVAGRSGPLTVTASCSPARGPPSLGAWRHPFMARIQMPRCRRLVLAAG
jgi:hypothetical protein